MLVVTGRAARGRRKRTEEANDSRDARGRKFYRAAAIDEMEGREGWRHGRGDESEGWKTWGGRVTRGNERITNEETRKLLRDRTSCQDVGGQSRADKGLTPPWRDKPARDGGRATNPQTTGVLIVTSRFIIAWFLHMIRERMNTSDTVHRGAEKIHGPEGSSMFAIDLFKSRLAGVSNRKEVLLRIVEGIKRRLDEINIISNTILFSILLHRSLANVRIMYY